MHFILRWFQKCTASVTDLSRAPAAAPGSNVTGAQYSKAVHALVSFCIFVKQPSINVGSGCLTVAGAHVLLTPLCSKEGDFIITSRV